MGKYYLGIDVGGTKAAYGLYDSNFELVHKSEHPSDKTLSAEAFFDGLIHTVTSIAQQQQISLEEIQGIGIGMPSFIVYRDGYIVLTSNLTNIKEFAAKQYMEQRLQIPTFLDNDANTAALAEYQLGAGRGFEHMLYCAVGTGISNGIIINGKLFRGSYGWAGESGHALITPNDGFLCGCENEGCFMSQTSGSMIAGRVKEKILAGQPSIMPKLAGGVKNITAKTILCAYHEGDELAKWAVSNMAKYLAIWLFNLYEILNINCYVFGGGLTKFENILFDKIFEQFKEYNHNEYPVYFKFAELKEDFGTRGAALLAQSETKTQ